MTLLKTVIQLTLLSVVVGSYVKAKRETPKEEQIVTLECSGSKSSSCEGTICTVSCSDGNKVELECKDGNVNMNSNQLNGKNEIQVICGSKLSSCFPLCGGGFGSTDESNEGDSRVALSFKNGGNSNKNLNFGNFNPFGYSGPNGINPFSPFVKTDTPTVTTEIEEQATIHSTIGPSMVMELEGQVPVTDDKVESAVTKPGGEATVIEPIVKATIVTEPEEEVVAPKLETTAMETEETVGTKPELVIVVSPKVTTRFEPILEAFVTKPEEANVVTAIKLEATAVEPEEADGIEVEYDVDYIEKSLVIEPEVKAVETKLEEVIVASTGEPTGIESIVIEPGKAMVVKSKVDNEQATVAEPKEATVIEAEEKAGSEPNVEASVTATEEVNLVEPIVEAVVTEPEVESAETKPEELIVASTVKQTSVSLECSGSTSSSCEGKICTVTCSDGNKVDLECESVNIKSNQVDGKNVLQISCGSTADLPKLDPCFPFCSLGAGIDEQSSTDKSNDDESKVALNNEQANVEESKEQASLSLECSGSTSSSCDGKLCTVFCSDGNKVDLECEGGSVNMNSNQINGKNEIAVSCGAKSDLPKFAPCFPFCNAGVGNAVGQFPFGNPLTNFNPFANFNPVTNYNPFSNPEPTDNRGITSPFGSGWPFGR